MIYLFGNERVKEYENAWWMQIQFEYLPIIWVKIRLWIS